MQDFKFKTPKNDQNPVILKLALLVSFGIDEGREGKGLFLSPFFDRVDSLCRAIQYKLYTEATALSLCGRQYRV